MLRPLILLVFVSLASALAGCGAGDVAVAPPAGPEGSSPEVAGEPTWAGDVQPLLAARCASCHGGERPAGGLDVTSWDRLIAGSDHGEALVAYDPDLSLLLELGYRLPAELPETYYWRPTMPFEEFREAHRLAPEEREILARWVASGARDGSGRVPFEDSAGRVFVAVQDAGMVAVLDVDALVVARHVHFDEYGGRTSTPHDTDYEPDGSAWYVTLINAQRIVKLDAATNDVIAELDVAAINPTYRPGMLAVDPTSDRLYLSRSISDLSGGRSVMFIDRAAMEAEEVLVPYTRPHPIGVTADGAYVLSGSLSDNLVAAIHTETWDITAPIRLDGTRTPLMHYAVSPDGRTAAITGQFSNQVYLLDVRDPENIQVRHATGVGQEPWYPAFSADGSYVVVPNHRSNTISIVEADSGRLLRTIEDDRFAMPHGAAASHDGRYIFVSNSNLTHEDDAAHGADPGQHEVNGDMGGFGERAITYQPRYPLDRSGDGRADNLQTGHVAVIDATTFEVLKIIEVEDFPSGLSLWQAGYPHH